ncbi:MAG TPA: efflux transporter periplasmic adaptor subunit, partial [Acidovorax temperans]|nr:efflux transporter periplasmic adaptor subunit [Acidovorax temperans]
RKVQPGRRVADRVEITAGLDANATVAVRGAGFLNEGDLVRVANDTADSKPKQAPAPATQAQAASK